MQLNQTFTFWVDDAQEKAEKQKAKQTTAPSRLASNLATGCSFYSCPHCGGSIEILTSEMNCRIFRHAAYSRLHPLSGHQVNPHASQREIESLLLAKHIDGCGRPFRIAMDGTAVACEYI